MNVGVVGAGLVGRRRAAVAAGVGDSVVTVADLVDERARGAAHAVGAAPTLDWRDVTRHLGIELVVVATVNGAMAPIVLDALEHGKHVLCEKPLGRNLDEATAMRDAALAAGRVLKVGFNHRHHPALAQAHELSVAGAIGPLLAIRAVYGHGGRAGYEREWRADPELAGGGELLDQGVHVLDLCRWFLGEFAEVSGVVATSFWDVAPLEDNAFALLRTADGRVASLHTSWTQWRNLFRFEAIGRDGYLAVEGLGGSYGIERLVHGRRRPELGVPAETATEFPGEDRSWRLEWEELRAAIAEGREPLGNADDGVEAARLVEAIYRSAREGSHVALEAAVA
ncbi:MAG: Gfo/Idh/MocA family protein [Gaiellaceae bacterium]